MRVLHVPGRGCPGVRVSSPRPWVWLPRSACEFTTSLPGGGGGGGGGGAASQGSHAQPDCCLKSIVCHEDIGKTVAVDAKVKASV